MRTLKVALAVLWCGCLDYDALTRGAPGDLSAASDFSGAEDLREADLSVDEPDLSVEQPDLAAEDLAVRFMRQSCVGMEPTCGSGGATPCCDSPEVLSGTFARSYDEVPGTPYYDMMFIGSVSNFMLDKFEVTVGRFRKFVNAGKGTRASPPAERQSERAQIPNTGWSSSWDVQLEATSAALKLALVCDVDLATWSDNPGADENRPINCVTWYEAFAFCVWDGGFLPTENEWNFAAAGGAEQRAYPWSSPGPSVTIDATYASYFVDGTKQCWGDGVDGCSRNDFIKVGSKPKGDGKWGQSDLAGNVWEWTLDVQNDPYRVTPCYDCAVLDGGTRRMVRGGTFNSIADDVRIGRRAHYPADLRDATLGFRCARVL